MSTKTEADVKQVMDTATNAFGDAMKAGVKAQEDMTKWWSDTFACGNPLGDFQKKSRLFFDEIGPAAQRHTQEFLKIIEQNYKRCVDLLRKAVDMDHNESIDGRWEKVRELWEESVNVVKENTEAMAQANVKLMEAWAEMLRKHFEQDEAFKSAAAAFKVAK
jgi:hypothetical protein